MIEKKTRKNLWQIVMLGLVIWLIVSALTRHSQAASSTPGQELETMGQPARLNSNPQTQAEKIKQITEAPVFSEFDAWVKEYLASNIRHSDEQIRRGEELALKRHELFKELMELAPRTALEQVAASADYKLLPAAVSKNLEQRISAYGDFLVYALDEVDPVTGELRGGHTEREVVIDTTRYKAFVYGRRETMTTKLHIPLQGIILDGMMVVDENPARKLESKEYADRHIDTTELGQTGVAAEVGGAVEYFSSQAAFDSFVQQQIKWEAEIGPSRAKGDEQPLSSWTEGAKTVLFIRVDFPDKPGEPVDFNNQPLNVTSAQSLMDTKVSPFYVNNSYNKTSMQTTVTPVVRMPQSQSFYFNNVGALFTDAESAARAAGFEANNFNLDVFAMSYNQGFPYAGVGHVGARGAALNGSFGLKVTAHELGHNYGLLHANLWRTTDGTVIGTGSNVEYGNPFDVMGGGGDSAAHFNAQYKRRLNWLTDANMQTVTSNGIYRIFAEDSATLDGIRVLKIRKNATKNYWIEFRQLLTYYPNTLNGAIINWDYLSKNFEETELLDMTPNTANDATDSPLLTGQTFNDDEDRIRVTVLGKGHTTPESLDVKVELNVGCSFSLSQTTQSFSASGGEGSIMVNTQSGCKPAATSNDSWLYAAPSDTGTVRYIVAANYDAQPRTGTINVAGQAFTVQQGAATTACTAPPAGLVAWWRGEGNALDQTGVNNGTLVNNMTFGGGQIGGGFLGDYSNNAGVVQVPDSSSLALNHSMTFEGWLKISSYGGTVIERSSSSTSSYQVWMLSSGQLFFTVWYNNNQGTGITTPNPIPLNQFVHFAASLDDATGQIRMYINGSLVQQSVITQRPNIISGATINVGNINGITDELSVYNRALSAAEIRAIYDTGTAASGATGKCLSPLDGNPGVVQFSSAAYSVNENAGTATITVNRTGGTAAFGVDYATSNGTATAGADYIATSGTLNFAPNETSKTLTVPILDDTAVEPNETINLTLSKPTGGATLGALNPAVLTIIDNDTLPTLSINDVSVAEGNTGTAAATFTVSLSTASSQTVTVNYATADGTALAGSDYLATSGTLTFKPNETSKSITVQVKGDTLNETDETFTVNLSNAANAMLARAQGTGTILNDDPLPTLSINDVTVAEGNSGTTTATFTVTLSAASGRAVTVAFATADGTAQASSDYQATSGTLSFAPGETSKLINVLINGDTTVEPNETFNVNLSNAVNATIADNQGVGTILNDDTVLPPVVQFSAANYTVSEGSMTANLTVVRTGDASGVASVDYRTADTDTFTVGCADTVNNHGSAYARCDFATVLGTLQFAAGETSKTISIPIIDDAIVEGDETFQVVLANPTGVTLGAPATATVTIHDNDTAGEANPVFTSSFFVRQHYLDFLSREPDTAGFNAWTNLLNGCSDVNNNPSCDRITVSQSFFGSQEFQLKGSYVFHFYKLAFNRLPEYAEIVSDMSFVAGSTSTEVFQRKAQFATNFTQRQEFQTNFGALSNIDYVISLLNRYQLTRVTTLDPANPDGNSKVTLTSADLVSRLNSNTLTRAQVLRAIADSDEVGAAEFNKAFVAMQYYGYLRRKPESSGYNAWLNYLNAHPTDSRTMVNGFVNSQEYRLRFGNPNQ